MAEITEERAYQISPVVNDSLAHNTKVRTPTSPSCTKALVFAIASPTPVPPPSRKHPPPPPLTPCPQTLSNLQSITASLIGITAGILGLESYPGFLFYLALSALTILLFHALRVAPDARAAGLGFFDTSRYFRGAFAFWGSGFMAGLPGFVLTWTLFYNLVRP